MRLANMSAPGWPLAGALTALLALVLAIPRATGEPVPADSCVVELDLPEGTKVTVDGRDFGAQRKFTFGSLRPGVTYQTKFVLTDRHGQVQILPVKLQGGQRLRPSAAGGVRAGQELGPQKWALLVGVDDYAQFTDLKYCSSDIHALNDRLAASGFRTDHIFFLEDQAKDKRRLPFKANIERELALMLRLVEKGDVVLIAFSGHGIHTGGVSYLCPTEADVERVDTLISLESVYQQLSRCPADLRLLVVDACRNDPVPEGLKGVRGKDLVDGFAQSIERPPQGILVMTSCAAGQQSVESPEFRNGVFMHYLTEGLDGAADLEAGNNDEQVSLLELYRYASRKTKTYAAQSFGMFQTPTLRGEIGGDFEIGRTTVPPQAAVAADPRPQPAQPQRAASTPATPAPPAAPAQPAQPAMAGTRWLWHNGSYDDYFSNGTYQSSLSNNPGWTHYGTWRLNGSSIQIWSPCREHNPPHYYYAWGTVSGDFMSGGERYSHGGTGTWSARRLQ